jgi:two-component system, chemotaxis family, response regulator Rcp1
MPLQVLLVEDNLGDIRLTREALCDSNILLDLHVATDGVDAMTFLRREGAHIHAPRPDLILLDLNLPKMDGREVLARIKEDDGFKTIPTLILSTSEAEVDIAISYRLQANCYLSKPVELDVFEMLVRSVCDFWLDKVKLPRIPRKSGGPSTRILVSESARGMCRTGRVPEDNGLRDVNSRPETDQDPPNEKQVNWAISH